MSQFWIEQGDAAEALKLIPSGSVDALVTDPPAGISFMDKEWDGPVGLGWCLILPVVSLIHLER